LIIDLKSKVIAAITAVTLLLAGTAYAHHSFPATYQINKVVIIEGKVAQLLLRNPHSVLQVDAPDAKGQMKRWSLEWGAAGQLINQGLAKDTIKVGDKLIVTANPARGTADSSRALLKTIKRPSDGWSWGTATSVLD
jgi:hypothetical protein